MIFTRAGDGFDGRDTPKAQVSAGSEGDSAISGPASENHAVTVLLRRNRRREGPCDDLRSTLDPTTVAPAIELGRTRAMA
jgi:hypothetical protein